jgi:hypothetical protein
VGRATHTSSSGCLYYAGVGAIRGRGSDLVRIRDIALAILGFQLFLRLVGAAGLHGSGRLTDIGEGDEGSISLHVACLCRYDRGQALTELLFVNRNRISGIYSGLPKPDHLARRTDQAQPALGGGSPTESEGQAFQRLG